MRKPRRASPNGRIWGVYAMWGLLAAVLIAWTGYWFVLRDIAVERVEAWVAAQKANGAEAAYSGVSASGFPFRLTLTYENANFIAPGGGWTLSTPRVALHINPANFNLFIIEPRDTVAWTTRGARRTFTPKKSAISVHVTDNKPDRVILDGEDIAVTRNDAPDMTIGSIVAGLRPDPRAAGDGQFSLEIKSLDFIALPKGLEAFGGTVQTLNAAIVLENGATLIAPSNDRVAAWKDAQGAARVEALGFVWGPANVTSTGRFVLDQQRRLEGKLDLTLEKPADVFAALAQSPTLSRDMANTYNLMAQANAALGVSFKPTLVIQNGVMLLNGFPLRTVDPIK